MLQVMKMVMPLLAPASGVINFAMAEGCVLAAGDLIARLELDDPGAVVRAKQFNSPFPELGPPQVCNGRHGYRIVHGCLQ